MTDFQPMRLLKRALGLEAVFEKECGISIGDRFELLDNAMSIWIVKRISQVQMSSSPLVSLTREDHPDLVKTVSLAALEDGEDFRPTLQ